ncbi:hypothetical protein N7445_008275 [Penicillium cf. griseofulvum]|nr:hypothetical protein N7445_008275 [Penicillium cf. griseofulvum]
MAEGGFGTGWEQSTSHNQITRSLASQTGYPDAATLVHLARALYLPRHDRKTTHIAVHDMSAQSAAATGTLPIGCTQYVVAVGTMPKPKGDGPDDITVAYDVDFNLGDNDAVMGSVKCRAPSSTLAEIDLYVAISPTMHEVLLIPNRVISTTEDQAAVLITNSENPAKISLDVTYPITPSSTRTGTVKHPYFTFEVPDADDEPTTFQWQIHPSQHGRLRYTLVCNPGSQEESNSPDIQAIYYHVGGLDDSLSLPYSEGMLLLPAGKSSVEEGIVVTSVLAMLWRLRELHRGKGKVTQAGKTGKLSSFKRMFTKE